MFTELEYEQLLAEAKRKRKLALELKTDMENMLAVSPSLTTCSGLSALAWSIYDLCVCVAAFPATE